MTSRKQVAKPQVRRVRRPALDSPHRPGGPPSRRRGGNGHHSYSAGEPVRQTGIYEVLHHREHRAVHEVVLHARDLFPPCDTCKQQVRFRLLRSAPYIFEDDDFAPE